MCKAVYYTLLVIFFLTQWFSKCITVNPEGWLRAFQCVCELKTIFVVILRCYFPFAL